MSNDINVSPLLLSTAYFPPVEYFALLLKYQYALIEVNETYQKQTWRNRCTIMTANGLLNLTVPVIKPNGNKSTTPEIKIFNDEKWYLIHKRAIQSAYRGSPFYLYYWDHFEDLFSPDHSSLLELNTDILQKVIKITGIKIKMEFTSGFIPYKNAVNDYRSRLSPKNSSLITEFPEYTQVFSDRYKFEGNLSILDVIFNLGPETIGYLKKLSDLLP